MPALRNRISTSVRMRLQLVLVRTVFRLAAALRPATAVARAGDLFCTPLRGTRQRALLAREDGAVRGGFDMDGHRIVTYAWGDPDTQPYVLFAHGWSSHGTRFMPWIAPLRQAGYAVVAFDQPAHGRSDGKRTTLPDFVCTLFAVAKRFGPAAALIGHSLGATAASVALARGLSWRLSRSDRDRNPASRAG